VICLVAWTSLSFSVIFLAALGGVPFTDVQQVALAGLYVGLGSGVAWGVSVHGSTRWCSVFNYVAALMALMSLAYLSSSAFAQACPSNSSAWLCLLGRFIIKVADAIVSYF
jgi:hypothetical protein